MVNGNTTGGNVSRKLTHSKSQSNLWFSSHFDSKRHFSEKFSRELNFRETRCLTICQLTISTWTGLFSWEKLREFNKIGAIGMPWQAVHFLVVVTGIFTTGLCLNKDSTFFHRIRFWNQRKHFQAWFARRTWWRRLRKGLQGQVSWENCRYEVHSSR